jgi:YD repeat-containing protein
MKMLKMMCILAVLVAACAALHGQAVNPSDVGFVPAGMYQHTDIDSVNMANGNAVIHIPLFGYPQLGSSLKLDYSIIANTSLWQPNIVCYPDGAGGSICENTYTMGNTPLGGGGLTTTNPCGFVPNASPAIAYLQSATWCEDITLAQLCQLEDPLMINVGTELFCNHFMAGEFNVVEPTGEEHRLQYDASNLSNLRTTDGSGYRLQVNDPQPYFPYYPSGNGWAMKDISGSVLTNSEGINLSANVLTDPNGNTIRSNGPNGIVDTVQRPIPFPPLGPTSNSTQGCPTLNAQYQPAIGSATWTVPGPNGQQTTFLLCFANVAYQTNFWSYGPRGYTQQSMDGNGNMSINVYSESNATEVVLQSVVLPDANLSAPIYWGFTYDAANPSDPSSIAYGTLTGILTPQKSSISYQYTTIADCGVYIEGEPVYVQRISQRTLTDADGNTAIWKYNFNFPLDGATYPLQSISTDPYGNDTVYGYKTYQCQTLPATTVHYAGPYSQNHVLRTENTDYQTVTSLLPTPYDTEDNIYANSFPKTVTEIDEVGNQAKTTYSYDPGFISAAPYCYTGDTYDIYYNGESQSPYNALGFCTTYENTLPVSFGLQASKSVFNYDGTPVTTDTTTYKWQDGALSSNPYYAKNLLTLPCLQSVYSPSQPAGVPVQCAISTQTNLFAETGYGYDEPNGSPSGIRGNRTSVSRWLNTGGSPVKSTVVYDSHGMPTDTYDGNLNAGLPGNHVHTTYDTTGLFPWSVQQSNTGSTAHIDYYSYDFNTGNVLWHTDENGASPTGNTPDTAHTTFYTYDNAFGRPTQILDPPTPAGRGETDISYLDTAHPTVTTTVKADPDPPQTSVKTYDSLGRLAQTTAASGATVETAYDLLGRVTSVSNPHFGTASTTDGYTTYVYDALGRKTYQYHPDRTYLQWSYSGFTTTTTDENGNSTQRAADALGRLRTVIEPGQLTTQYSYDALNNLLSVRQSGSASLGDAQRYRSFTYDSLSHLLTSTNPETGTVCYGQWSYAGCVNGYDAGGNLKYKTDARGVTTNYAYDNLNRLLAKTYINAPAGSLSSCYAFDTATDGIGKLGVEWTTAGSCSSTSGYQTMRQYLAYDSMGRLWNEQQCVLGHCTSGPPPPCAASGNNATPYQTYCYDLAGNMIWNTIGNSNVPGANTIGFSYTYDAGGQLSTLGSTWSDGLHPSPLFTAAPTNGYSPAGALQNFTLGNSISVIKTYDNRLRTTWETATQK